MSLTKKEIIRAYEALKKLAKKSFRKGARLDAIMYLKACTNLACQFNFRYRDNELEAFLRTMAGSVIKQKEEYASKQDRWILYDDFCTSYVLALQWLEAMVLSGRQILYITTRDTNKGAQRKNILDFVSKYKNVDIVIIPQDDVFSRVQMLYDTIVQFEASKIVLHKRAASSLMDIVLPALPRGLERYIINLSDQTFWMGSSCVDYCLEFRPFGASVSLQRRGMTYPQLLMVPFYPADDGNRFMGFPLESVEGKILIFSGGDYYKTLDEKRTYWRLVRRILTTYPQVVFLFATKNIPEGDAEIWAFIENNHFEQNFFYIGFRPDIYQVFAHCDIFMGTSPTSGSLMSQLAAINGKPILQYYSPGTPDDETEQAVCINESFSISFHNEESFMDEAGKLINDAPYRIRQGERLKHAMMQRKQFNELVLRTLETNQTQTPIFEYSIDYKVLEDRWYYLEKAGYINALMYYYGVSGRKHCLKYTPGLFVKKQWNRIRNKLQHR